MKKNVLITGIIYVTCGLSLFLFAIFGPEVAHESILWGFGGAGVGPGIMMIGRYFYYSRPGKKEEYEARLMQERIELKDERRIMLRDKSGRIMYLIMVGLIVCLIYFLSIFKAFGVIEVDSNIILFLSFFLVLQFFISQFVTMYLDKRL